MNRSPLRPCSSAFSSGRRKLRDAERAAATSARVAVVHAAVATQTGTPAPAPRRWSRGLETEVAARTCRKRGGAILSWERDRRGDQWASTLQQFTPRLTPRSGRADPPLKPLGRAAG